MKLKEQMTMLAVLSLLVGCNRNDQSQKETDSNTPVTAKEVQERYKQAATATKDYAAETKDEFIVTMDKKLKALDAKIDELAKKSESYKDDAKVQADKALAELREQRDKAQRD